MSDPAINDLGHEEGCKCPTCLPEAHPAPVTSTALAPRADTYEWNGVRFYTFKGRQCCIAQEFGSSLRYADEGRGLPDVIRKDWARESEDGRVEMLEGKDYAVLKGDELREFKALSDVGTSDVPSRAPSLTILSEKGVDKVILKTGKARTVWTSAGATSRPAPR